MSPDAVFSLCNTLALLAWLALAFSPARSPWSARVRWMAGRAVPVLLSVVYLLMLLAHWRGEGGFGSPAEVRALFDVPGVLVAGWVHYLAFDLFVGSWIAGEAARRGWPHALLLPLLLLCFLFGPLGLLAFAAVRSVRRDPFPPTGVTP